MPTLYSAATLTVAALYCVWRAYIQARQRRQGLLAHRVAYLLWTLAEGEDEPAFHWHGSRPHGDY